MGVPPPHLFVEISAIFFLQPSLIKIMKILEIYVLKIIVE